VVVQSAEIMKKIVSIIAAFSLLLNSFYVPVVAIAQELSSTPEPTPIVESTETPPATIEPSAQPTELPTEEPTQESIPTEIPVESISPTPTVETLVLTTTEPTSEPIQSDEPAVLPSSTPEIKSESTENIELKAVILENTDSETVNEYDFSSSEYSSATLITDKADYAPTDTVLITGNGFVPNKEYGIEITSDTGNFKFGDKVTSDESGGLFYAYQLDGTYRPNYKVEVRDGSIIISSVTFTDSASPAIVWPTTWNTPNSCVYDPSGESGVSPTEVDLIGSSGTPAVGFSSDSNYYYFRERVNGNPGTASSLNNYSWVVLFQTSSPQYQYLAAISGKSPDSNNKVVLYDNLVNSPVSTGVDFDPLFNDPADNIVWQGPSADYGRVTGTGPYYIDWAIPILELTSRGINTSTNKFFATSANANNYNKDHLQCYDQFADLSIEKTDSPDPVVSGSTLTYTLSIHNAGPDTASSVIVTDNLPTGYVVTSVTPSRGTCSDIIAPDLQCELGDMLSGDSATITIVGTLTTSASSVNNTASVTLDTTKSIDLNLANNTDTEPTAVNLAKGGLIVNKVVVNDSGGDLVISNFPLFVGSQSVNSGETNSYTPGTYTVSETGNSGYSATFSGDCNSQGQVEVISNVTKTCTITNNDIAPTITLIKNVIKDNGGTAGINDFGLSIGATSVTSGQKLDVLANTNIEINEAGLAGYEFVSITGTNCPTQLGGVVNLSLGQNITCVITNNDIQPKLTVLKTVVNDNGGTKIISDFPLFVDSTSVTSGIQNGFNAGSYTISETNQTGYSSTIGGDCSSNGSITLVLGQTKTCTIINDDISPSLILVKNVTNNNGGGTSASSWTLTATGPTGFSGAGPTVSNGASFDAGTYTLTESGPDGYTPSNWVCVGGAQQIGSNVVTLGLGESATCTIVNDDISPSLTIVKHVTNDNGGTANITDWTLTATGATTISGLGGAVSDTDFSAGTYVLSESGPQGYTASDWSCVKNGGNPVSGSSVNIRLGDNVVCSITNDDNSPSLTLVKNIINDNGGLITPTSWTLTATGPTSFSGNGPTVSNGASFDIGNYDLSESGPQGYTASNWVCVGGNQVDGDTVSLGLGQNATCTITNNDQAGILIVKKFVENNYGGLLQVNDFGFKVNDGTTIPFEVDGQNDLTVDAGTYSVVEPNVSGYSTSYDNCTDIVISNGESQTCTITNSDIQPKLTVVKVVVNDNGGTKDVSDFPLFVGTTEVTSEVENGFNVGNYVVSETSQDGYAGTISGDCDEKGNVSLALGDSKICTITNDDLAGHLIVRKVTNPVNDPTNFVILLEGGNLVSGRARRNLSTIAPVNYEVDAGTFSVSEDSLPGWDETSNTCSDIVIGIGETKECTITNTKLGSIQGKKFEDMNSDGDRDSGDNFMNNWTINLYERGDHLIQLIRSTTTGDTGTLGQYKFKDLKPGRYLVCETLKDGWIQSGLVGSVNTELNPNKDGSNCFDVTLGAGEDLIGLQFGNFELGSVIGKKYDDVDGDGMAHELNESYLDGWDIRLYSSDWQTPKEVTTSNTGVLGQYKFADLYPGTYYICEVQQTNYSQTWPKVSDVPVTDTGITHPEYGVAVVNGSGNTDEAPVCWQTEISTSGQQNSLLRFGNAQLGSIHGYKWNDINQDGQRCPSSFFTRGLIDVEFGCEEKLSGWTIELYKITEGDGQDIRQLIDSMQTDGGEEHFGEYWFENLLPGTYEVCEVNKPRWEQTYPGSCHRVVLPDDNFDGYNFGNFLKDPNVEITKSNNKNNAQRGDIVTYTLTLTNSGNMNLENVKVIDALPGGFSYIAGTSMLDGVSISDPTISGNTLEWNIGSVEKDGIKVITYNAKISDSVINGSYKNLATCNAEIGRFNGGFDTLLFAAIQIDQIVETTECNIADSTVNVGLGLSYGGNLNGQVLGASIELPATGNPTWLLALALLGLTTGLYLKKNKNGKNKSKLLSFLVALLGLMVFAKQAMAITPTVSIQGLPSYVNTNDFKLSCSALGGSNVQFSYKKEGGSYQDFGSLIDITSNPCQVQVTSLQVTEEAKFYFKVTLDGGVSDETSVIFDNSGPSPVSGYYRDVLGSENKLHWRNPSDADFDSVIIYRGETVDFSADSSHEIAKVSGSPNSDMTYGNDASPDKTYYYSIRAIDKAGNSSSLVGDGSTTTTTTTVTQTQPQNGSGSVRQLPKEATGQVLGDEKVETSESGNINENPSLIEKIAHTIPNNKFVLIGGGLILLAIILNILFKKYKNK